MVVSGKLQDNIDTAHKGLFDHDRSWLDDSHDRRHPAISLAGLIDSAR